MAQSALGLQGGGVVHSANILSKFSKLQSSQMGYHKVAQ